MTLGSESSASEIEELRDRMPTGSGARTENKDFNSSCWEPAIELTESERYLQLKAELPGIDAKDIVAIASPTAVAIKGKYCSHDCDENHQNKSVCHSEFRYGNFERIVNLPVPIDNDKAEAEYINGVLTLTLPKMDQATAEAMAEDDLNMVSN